MERASLRPVPLRPSGPVEPAEALAHVGARLPELDEAARQALALVELVGRSRPELRAETGIEREQLAAALARARKALRRATFPLPGSGWCERAERLLSDRLDGELEPPGPRMLEVHLTSCDRCVEHERRLWQARDRLVESFEEARAAAPAPRPEPEPVEQNLLAAAPELPPEPPPPPELRVVETPAPLPDPSPLEPLPDPEPLPTLDDEPLVPAAAAGTSATGLGISAAGLAWTALMALAVALTVISIVITAIGVSGGGI